MTRIQGVLFDLDGTLADTAPDLAWALNETLHLNGRKPLPFETIRPAVSHGGIALIHLGFGIESDNPDFEPLRQTFLRIYQDNICRQTRLFPGMAEVLDELEQRAIPWGIVTNKPAWLTNPLLAAMKLDRRAASIISSDTTAERKPHPLPMLTACRQLGSEPRETLYIGDAERDIQAAHNAGMPALVALFGYIGEEDRPGEWGAEGMIAAPNNLSAWLEREYPTIEPGDTDPLSR